MMAANQGRTGPVRIDGVVIGVHLAPNSVGQHSMGIDWLLHRLGAASADAYGLREFDGHVVRSIPEWTTRTASHEERHLDMGARRRRLFTSSATLCVEGHVEHAMEVTTRYGQDSVVTGAWDDSSFAIRGWEDEGRRIVDTVQEALQALDLAVWVSGDVEFGHGHLCIVRRSSVPMAMVRKFDDAVAGRRRLQDAAATTGIAERLTAIGQMSPLGRMRPYYALSPSWIDEETAKRSAHPVKFFLNPSRQDVNQSGWFTVEELDEWIAGRGPIPKKGIRGEEE